MRGPTAVAVLVIVVASACGPSVGSPSPSSNVVKATPRATPGPSETPLPVSGVVIDARLLGVLPESVAGITIVESPDGEASALADPNLDTVAVAVAAGLAIEPASGDFVFAVVVRLLPGAMDETVLRAWRDSYDQGACSQADGVAGHAETEIGGHSVYIGTCVGGLRTYHVWLEDREILISASAAGDRLLGELLVGNLRP